MYRVHNVFACCLLHSYSYKFHTYLEETVDLSIFTETIQSQLLLLLQRMSDSDSDDHIIWQVTRSTDQKSTEPIRQRTSPQNPGETSRKRGRPALAQNRGETSRNRGRPAKTQNRGETSTKRGRPAKAQNRGESSKERGKQRGRPALPRTIRGTLLNYVSEISNVIS